MQASIPLPMASRVDPGSRIAPKVSRRWLSLLLIGAGALLGQSAFVRDWSFMGQQLPATLIMTACLTMLLLLWSGVGLRREGAALMLGWYLGAGTVIPGIWAGFFGPSILGDVAWIAWSLMMAAPYALAPRMYPRLGVLCGLVITSVPPIGVLGMVSPMLAAGAMFPGWGWLGLACVLLFFALQAFDSKWVLATTSVVALFGAYQAVKPAMAPPTMAYAVTSYIGTYPDDPIKQFAIQDRLKKQVSDAIRKGAKLIVLPEGADPYWNDGQVFYWQDVKALALRHHAQVLIGVYIQTIFANSGRDALYDLTSGKTYAATMPMPIGMWKPWQPQANFPVQWKANLIPTAFGPAAYSICYEDLLLWPVAMQMAGHRPTMLISAANQWFAHGHESRPQSRSIALQARLWGVPLLRSVNHATLD